MKNYNVYLDGVLLGQSMGTTEREAVVNYWLDFSVLPDRAEII